VLPEALMNYLALLGWAPHGGDREIFSRDELIKEFQLERVTPSPAVFDFDKLYWLNRHYVKEAPADRLATLARPYFASAGLLTHDARHAGWLRDLLALLAPSVDRLDQLPPRAALVFEYDATAARSAPENAEVFAWPKTKDVIAAFARRAIAEPAGTLTAERFKAIMNEVKAETGAKGKELFHPMRIMLTGSHSGPEFDKLIPLIEQGSKLDLPRRVKSIRERVEEFVNRGDTETQRKAL